MKHWLLLFLVPCVLFCVPLPPNRTVTPPFISGDAFRSFCDFAYDELTTSMDPTQVQPGNVVFVKTDYAKDFFDKVHPRIEHPYVLVTHNSDDVAPGVCAKYLDDPKILAWFAQNYDGTPHPKMHPIPIGIANACWGHGNVQTLAKVQAMALAKKHLAYMNIVVQTFPSERKVVFDHLAKKSYCRVEEKVPHEPFLKAIASSAFVVSPRGNGLDTHRLWEALYLGSIPVVRASSIDPVYEGLPVLVVKEWSEVSEEFLNHAKQEMGKKSWQREKLSIDYWRQEIRRVAQRQLNSSRPER